MAESLDLPVPSTPEYAAFRKNYTLIIGAIKSQAGVMCDVLFGEGYITPTARSHIRNRSMIDEEKARMLADAVIDRIEHDPNVFHRFLELIQSPFMDHLTSALKRAYQSECEMLAKDDETRSTGDHSASEFPPFLCPYCGKCSLEQFFSEEGCPIKENTSNSNVLFPYLSLSDLDDDNRIDLEGRLVDDTKAMIKQFATFTAMIRSSLKDLQTPLEEIKDSVLSLEAFSEEIGVKVLDKIDAEKIENAKSIAEIFITLRKYVSFINYEVIEHIVELHGSADDHKKLREYLCTFNAFCERNVFEVPARIFSAKKGRNTAKVFALKCTQRVYSLEGVQSLKRKIAKALGLRPLSLQLCSIKKGCIELHFLISAAVASVIVPVSSAHLSALSDIGVRVLFCEYDNSERQKDSKYVAT